MMAESAESWSTLQLTEFVALVSGSTDEHDATQRAVERAAEALEAEVCVLMADRVQAAIGFPTGSVPESELSAAVHGNLDRVELPGLGEMWNLAMPLDDDIGSALWVARVGNEGFSQEESDLLRGMARSLALTLRMVRTVHHERALRRQSQREIRQRKKVERELAHQALHDGLTGLANRVLLRDRAIKALERSQDSAALLAALVLDLDHFKVTNDTLGHGLGDQVLLMVGKRIELAVAGDGDPQRNYTVARTGGDEFVVLCEELISEHEAVGVAQRIQRALRTPFVLEGRELSITASMGIAVAGGASEQADAQITADELLRDAEVATGRAKQGGRDCYEVFDAEMRVRLLDRIQLEADMRAALDSDELRLVYQPVVAVEDGAMVSVEALLRWEHPRRGALLPGQFVPVAEESDLILALGTWVLNEACDQLVRWRHAHPAGASMRVSVNVSARQLRSDLISHVEEALTRTGIHPSQLCLEITETLLIEQSERTRGILESLKRLGVGIVLDDFGTGYSSLSYLKSFPLDQLKIDRSFIATLTEDPRSAKIVSAIIEMARALGMIVVAEGVETAEQLEVLQRLGCDYAQGWRFAAPMAAAQVSRRIAELFQQDRVGTLAAREAAARIVEPDTSLQAPDESEKRRRETVGRVAGLMFCIGGVLSLPACLLIDHPPSLSSVIGLAILGFLSGGLCLAAPWRKMSWRWVHVTAGLATAEVALTVRIDGHPAVFSWFYLLIGAVVGYAIAERRGLIGQVLLIASAMALPLLYMNDPTGDAGPRTLLGVAVVAVTVGVVSWLRAQLESHQADLRELAARDPLTGVGNYRHLHERLEYELRRHQRSGRELALLLIDLDRFKQVNESKGHAAGDDVLRRVARAICGAVRHQDTVARQGGDEFAVLAPETDAEGAMVLAGRIREGVSRVQLAGETVGATVGFSIYPRDGGSAQLLLARADSRLLSGKARTRSRELPPASMPEEEEPVVAAASDLVGAPPS